MAISNFVYTHWIAFSIVAAILIVGIVLLVVFLRPRRKKQRGNFMRGGWCQCFGGNKPTFSSNSNIIIAGGFQSDSTIGPFCYGGAISSCQKNMGRQAMDAFPTRWLSVGGDKVGTEAQEADLELCLANTVEHVELFDFHGIAFDMEGCVGSTSEKASENLAWMKQRTELTGKKSILVNGAASFANKELYDQFDYVAPMMYGGEDSYISTASTDQLIRERVDPYNGLVEPARLFITYQTDALFNSGNKLSASQILTALVVKAHDGGYAGILGWPSQKGNQELAEKIIDDALTDK